LTGERVDVGVYMVRREGKDMCRDYGHFEGPGKRNGHHIDFQLFLKASGHRRIAKSVWCDGGGWCAGGSEDGR
jgi:hypothetical protein